MIKLLIKNNCFNKGVHNMQIIQTPLIFFTRFTVSHNIHVTQYNLLLHKLRLVAKRIYNIRIIKLTIKIIYLKMN